MNQLQLLATVVEFASFTLAFLLGIVTPFNGYGIANTLYFYVLLVTTIVVNVGGIFAIVFPEIQAVFQSAKHKLLSFNLLKLFVHFLLAVFYVIAITVSIQDVNSNHVATRIIAIVLVVLVLLAQIAIVLVYLRVNNLVDISVTRPQSQAQQQQNRTRAPDPPAPTAVKVQKPLAATPASSEHASHESHPHAPHVTPTSRPPRRQESPQQVPLARYDRPPSPTQLPSEKAPAPPSMARQTTPKSAAAAAATATTAVTTPKLVSKELSPQTRRSSTASEEFQEVSLDEEAESPEVLHKANEL